MCLCSKTSRKEKRQTGKSHQNLEDEKGRNIKDYVDTDNCSEEAGGYKICKQLLRRLVMVKTTRASSAK